MITLINRQRKIALDESWYKELLQELLTQIKYADFDLGVLVTTNATIRRYNELFRHKKGPTDILSFPYYPDLKPGAEIQAQENDEKNLGDIILSLEYIKRSAAAQGVSFEHHLMILTIHGICHLLGYDHETDEDYSAMQSLEDSLHAKLPHRIQR